MNIIFIILCMLTCTIEASTKNKWEERGRKKFRSKGEIPTPKKPGQRPHSTDGKRRSIIQKDSHQKEGSPRMISTRNNPRISKKNDRDGVVIINIPKWEIVLTEEESSLIKSKEETENEIKFFIDRENYYLFIKAIVPHVNKIKFDEILFKKSEDVTRAVFEALFSGQNCNPECECLDTQNNTILFHTIYTHNEARIEKIFNTYKEKNDLKSILTRRNNQQNTIFHQLFLKPGTKKKLILKLLDLLIEKCNESTLENMINDQNDKGDTPLHFACTNYLSLISELVMRGAKLNIPNKKEKTVADLLLSNFIALQQQETKNKEEKKKAKLFFTIITNFKNIQNQSGNTLMHELVTNELFDLLPDACKSEQSPNIKNNNGQTALDLLFHFLFKKLPFCGKEKEVRIKMHGDVVKQVELLLKYNGDSNLYLDEENNSALHCAVIRNDPKLVNLLLKFNIDVKKQNNQGKTAFHIAFNDILLDKGIFLAFMPYDETIRLIQDNDHCTAWNVLVENPHCIELFNEFQQTR